jgi:hypothetical protein
VTDSTARALTNVALATVGVAAAYVILTRPPLRRLAFQALRWWLGASVPVYLLSQVREAWVESARAA